MSEILRTAHQSLFAIRKCSDLKMLPWHGRVSDYSMPAYLKDVVVGAEVETDHDRNSDRIQEVDPICQR